MARPHEGVPIWGDVVERGVSMYQRSARERRNAMLRPFLHLRNEILISGKLIIFGVTIDVWLREAAADQKTIVSQGSKVDRIDGIRYGAGGKLAPLPRLP